MAARTWSDADVVALHALDLARHPHDEIARTLGRTPDAVRKKIASLAAAESPPAAPPPAPEPVRSQGRRADLRGVYFRSAWEANVARWLDFQGLAWTYEPTTFWFEGIRRGTRSYTPDFYLPAEDRYIEVKGWWDPKSVTRMKRMARYHPAVRIEIIDAGRYAEISALCAGAVPGWERPSDRPPRPRRARPDEIPSSPIGLALPAVAPRPRDEPKPGWLPADGRTPPPGWASYGLWLIPPDDARQIIRAHFGNDFRPRRRRAP